MPYEPNETRYDSMTYNRCGSSGLMLPAVSLGLWHNFGETDSFENSRNMLFTAFDLGITHFDLANNYGPPAGSAETNFGKILKADLSNHRDEFIISTKAGHIMWPGPYGKNASRKSLLASLDRSLKRMNLDYVDIFYSHCPDPETPLEETMAALSHAVKSGKSLYVGISKYDPERTAEAAEILKNLNTPCLIHQPRYSMLDRKIEHGLLDTLEDNGIGCICFSALAQGLLTDKYIGGIPENSRAAGKSIFLNKENITDELVKKISALNDIAGQRSQSLAQMAVVWVLRDKRVTSALVGASCPEQIENTAAALNNPTFTDDELNRIESILQQ